MKKETLNAYLTAHAKARKVAEKYYESGKVERSGEAPSTETVEYLTTMIETIQIKEKTLPEIRKYLKELAVSDPQVMRALQYFVIDGLPLIEACKRTDALEYKGILKRVSSELEKLK